MIFASQIWDFDTVFTPTNLINSSNSVILVYCFHYPGIPISIVKPTCFHQFMVSSPWLLPVRNHALLRDLLAKSASLFTPAPNLTITPVLTWVLCHTCFWFIPASLTFLFCSLPCSIYVFIYLAPPLAHFGQEIEFVSWFCFTDTNCPLTSLLLWSLFPSLLSRQLSVHIGLDELLPSSANSILVLLLLLGPRRIYFF